MTIHTHNDTYEPAHTASQTAHALENGGGKVGHGSGGMTLLRAA